MEEYRKQLVLNMMAYAAQRDLSPEKLSHLSGIDLFALKNGTATSLTSKQLHDLWQNAVKLSGDAAFGLHFGESLQLAAIGAVGQIIQTSKTVGEALTQAASLAHLVSDLFMMEVSNTAQGIQLRFVPDKGKRTEHAFVLQQVMELFMVFSIHELDGLILEKIKPLRISFPLNEEVDIKEYERVLRCRPSYDAKEYTMLFDKRYWDEPIITANFELQQILLQKVGINSKTTATEIPLSEKIVNYLTANAYLGIASLEEIASNFNTSPRTLQRKLQEEGISYQQLADSVRKSIALHYLQSGDHPVKEISYLLGYNEQSAFIRAFKRWTGTTPMDYKRGKHPDD